MRISQFRTFRLVGGTALSLQIGHRESIDIDLFSDQDYGTINFDQIEESLFSEFQYVDSIGGIDPAFGKSYLIGFESEDVIKLDVFYTDPFIQPATIIDEIRMASIEEIIAMKLDVVQRGGRKKDFWDLHELMSNNSFDKMLELHQVRYPYDHDEKLILKNFIDFTIADEDLDPKCLRGKYWEFIKEDILENVRNHRKTI